jgi:DNA-binding FrmR family transcriptional regulator
MSADCGILQQALARTGAIDKVAHGLLSDHVAAWRTAPAATSAATR